MVALFRLLIAMIIGLFSSISASEGTTSNNPETAVSEHVQYFMSAGINEQPDAPIFIRKKNES